MTIPAAGVSVHCFANFKLETHLPAIAAQGIRLIELSCEFYELFESDEVFAETRRVLADTGLQAWSIHVPFSGTTSEGGALDVSDPDPVVREKALGVAEACARRLAELNGHCIVIHPSCEPVEEDDAHRRQRWGFATETLLALKDRMPPDADIRIAIECLPRTNLCRESAESIAFLEALDDPVFGICLDVNHTNFREDPVEVARKCAPHVVTTHVSDNDGEHERHWLPGLGVIPMREWIGALREGGYTGPLIYETSHPGGETPEETVAILAGNMREFGLL